MTNQYLIQNEVMCFGRFNVQIPIIIENIITKIVSAYKEQMTLFSSNVIIHTENVCVIPYEKNHSRLRAAWICNVVKNKNKQKQEMSDSELYKKIQLGDSLALNTFLEKNQKILFKILLLHLNGDMSLAEDVYLQVVFEFGRCVVENQQTGKSIDNCQAFIVTIAKRRAKDAIRAEITKRKKEEELEKEYEVNPPNSIINADPSKLVELDCENKRLHHCLKELESDEQEMLLMWSSDNTAREIAQRYSCSHSKIVRLINNKLLPRLRRCLGGDEL